MEKQIKLLEKLGYTIEELNLIHYYPESRSSKESKDKYKGTIAYKGVKPKLYSVYADTYVQRNEFDRSEYNITKVYNREYDRILFEMVLNFAIKED